ncbi:MAG: hypothetical protein Q8L07_01620 [Sediminibacterium sp.]|nr:hypothetical protein [Sediminibacterium sp.]MDP1812103.1 hypothetical protein [Sediminibacterium sp.]MDP3127021.1 hypothetical protein [Sediminibacterium sp.]
MDNSTTPTNKIGNTLTTVSIIVTILIGVPSVYFAYKGFVKSGPKIVSTSTKDTAGDVSDKVTYTPSKPPILINNHSPIIRHDPQQINTHVFNKSNQPIEIKKEEVAFNSGEFVNETTSEMDIAIIIIDNNKQSLNSISSDIANLYRSSNHSVTTSLFTAVFFHSKYLDELINSNAQLIVKLNLSSHAKYIIVGKYSNAFETGDYTKFISRATLDVVIISCATKSQIDGFTLSAANGYDDKEHAEKGAKEKLILDYKRNHLNL